MLCGHESLGDIGLLGHHRSLDGLLSLADTLASRPKPIALVGLLLEWLWAQPTGRKQWITRDVKSGTNELDQTSLGRLEAGRW